MNIKPENAMSRQNYLSHVRKTKSLLISWMQVKFNLGLFLVNVSDSQETKPSSKNGIRQSF